MNAIATFVTEYVLQVTQWNGNYEELVRIWSMATYVAMVVFRIICNISSEDFIANIAMDIPSYISLNHL